MSELPVVEDVSLIVEVQSSGSEAEEEQDPLLDLQDFEVGALESQYRIVVQDGRFLWRTWRACGGLEDSFEDTRADAFEEALGSSFEDASVHTPTSSEDMLEGTGEGTFKDDEGTFKDSEGTLKDDEGTFKDDEGTIKDDESMPSLTPTEPDECPIQAEFEDDKGTYEGFGCGRCSYEPRGCLYCREDAQVPSP